MQIMNTFQTIDFLELFNDCWQTCLHWGAFHQHSDTMQESDARGVEHNDCEYVGADWVHVPGAWDEVNYQSGN